MRVVFSQSSLDKAEAERAALPMANNIHLSRCDVTDRAMFESWLEEIWEGTAVLTFSSTMLPLCAGQMCWRCPLRKRSKTMRVGYDGPVIGIKNSAAPDADGWARSHRQHWLGSRARFLWVGSSAAYAASKAAIDAYTQMLHVELANSPVNATIVRLGTVAGTDFFPQACPQ